MQPDEILVQPVTGFQLASVHSILLRFIIIHFYHINHFNRNPGGTLNRSNIQKELGNVSSPLAKKIVDGLVSSQLVSLLPGFQEGKKALNAREKVYPADHAMPSAISRLGLLGLDDPVMAGQIAENMVFNHLKNHTSMSSTEMAYWKRSNKKEEVDFVMLPMTDRIPVEVKYQTQIDPKNPLGGLPSSTKTRGLSADT